MFLYTILYVADPLKSAAFYAKLFEREAVEASPGFALFVLDGGSKLGLWQRDDVKPDGTARAGGAELVVQQDSDAAVDERFADWTARGVLMLQSPVDLDFGHTFVAVDPDGQRLRVFHPSEG
ncbi:VOC family protein [Devosia sp.]|uniref:VOC family protein n=1 Tax=Devosia sp. TaxID=1871048 RepID=UPI003265EB62